MTWAPSTYFRAMLSDAIASGMPVTDGDATSETLRSAEINAAVHSIRRYLKWHGVQRDGDIHVTLTQWIGLYGTECNASWDGDNFNWEHYVDRLQERISNFAGTQVV